jgi:hypothetical protein
MTDRVPGIYLKMWFDHALNELLQKLLPHLRSELSDLTLLTTNGAGAPYPFVLVPSKDRRSRALRFLGWLLSHVGDTGLG